MTNTDLTIFEDYNIRRKYDEENGKWYFSIVDIIAVLTQHHDRKKAKTYWTTLKNRLKEEGSEVVTKCDQLKLEAADGKKYLTDVTGTETLFRIIQSVPSPKAEPIKLWLAKVGYERMEELADPERSLNRARKNWKQYGRSEKWIEQRMRGQETRNKLTDYWGNHDIKKGKEYAILTNIIHQEWTDISIKDHKKMKGLKTQNLRDHMNEAELLFTALAELSTRQIAESADATGMIENKSASKKGGGIAKKARMELEEKTGKKIISGGNYLKKNNNKKRLK